MPYIYRITEVYVLSSVMDFKKLLCQEHVELIWDCCVSGRLEQRQDIISLFRRE